MPRSLPKPKLQQPVSDKMVRSNSLGTLIKQRREEAIVNNPRDTWCEIDNPAIWEGAI